MQFSRHYVVGLLGLSIASGFSVYSADIVSAQGLRERLLQRIESQQNGQPGTQPVTPPGIQPGTPPEMAPGMGGMQPGMPPVSDVSMVTLQTVPGPGGSQMVITPKGMQVPLPGIGVNGPVVHVYMGARGGYWYTDKNNQQVDLTTAVQNMQAMQAQARPVSAIPQYAPPPQNYGSPINTAAAAGLGAMAGAAMSTSSSSGWGTVPYGTPVHYGAGAVPYYDQGGKPVYINASTTSAAVNETNMYHATAMAQQENWYKQQQLQQGANWKAWQQPTANPFVNSQYQHYGAAAGATAAQYGAMQGQQAEKYGAAAGASAAHYGAEQGQQAERYGAAAGASAAHYGAEQGQQAEKYGAAAGAGAAHYGKEQGQESERHGAEAGAGAAHYGKEQGQQSERRGAAAGEASAHSGRFGRGEGAGSDEGSRRRRR